MFSKKVCFTGRYESSDQQDSIPPSLLSLVAMLLDGPGNLDSREIKQAVLSISQLIMFNAARRSRKQPCADKQVAHQTVRHLPRQETTLPVYIGLTLHSATRKKALSSEISQNWSFC